MKNLLALTLVSLFSMVFLTQCKKDDLDKDFTVNFYTSEEDGKMSLFIDDEYKGELLYMAAIPECGKNYGDGAAPLSFTLKSGSYKITGKNEQGLEVSTHIIRLSASTKGASGRMGGCRMDGGEDCVAVGLFD